MKKCVVKVSKLNGVKIAGNIFLLKNGDLTFDVLPGYEQLMSSVASFPTNDKENWFNNLPRKYHGSYMWVEMV